MTSVRLRKCKAFYVTPNNIFGWHYTITYDYASGSKERYTVIARRPSRETHGEESFVIGVELPLDAVRKVISKHQVNKTFVLNGKKI